MMARNCCKTMEAELTAWKANVYDIVRKMEEMPGGTREKMTPNIEDLHMLIAEMGDRVEQIRENCTPQMGIDDIRTERKLFDKSLSTLRVTAEEAMAAGIATLEILSDPRVYDRLEKRGAQLAEGTAENLKKAGVRAVQNRVGSISCLFFTRRPVRDFTTAAASNTKRFGAYFAAMLRGGIYLAPSQFEASFISLAHTNRDIEKTLAVQRRVLKKL